ncbi:hypothetical protein TNCV_1299401 [Trichonephila clavipes]|nr:hypothetical protein TNCV_1299401 [Trichonephila clavipes]
MHVTSAESSNVLPLVWWDRRGGASSGVVLVIWPWLKMTSSVAKFPRVAEQCDVYLHSLTLRWGTKILEKGVEWLWLLFPFCHRFLI